MRYDEYEELLSLLEEAGVKATLCCEPVPVSLSSARCGLLPSDGQLYLRAHFARF